MTDNNNNFAPSSVPELHLPQDPQAAEQAVEAAEAVVQQAEAAAQSTAQQFGMPEPPQAPQPQQPVYAAPQQPQYQQPQYQQPQYQQPQQYQAPQYPAQPYQQFQQPVQRFDVPPEGYPQKSRIAAGILAVLFGCFGVHNFYLGNKNRAIIQLVICLAGSLLCGLGAIVAEVWGLIEGIQILTAADPDRNYDGNGVILKD